MPLNLNNERRQRAYLAVGIALLVVFGFAAATLRPHFSSLPSRDPYQTPNQAPIGADVTCQPPSLGGIEKITSSRTKYDRCIKAQSEEKQSSDTLSESRYESDISKEALVTARYQSWTFFWQVFATVAAFIAASVAAWFAKSGADEMQRSADTSIAALKLAQSEFIAAHRPWLSVDVTPSQAMKTDDLRAGAYTIVEFTIKNVGGAPAQRILISYLTCFSDKTTTKQIEAIELLSDPKRLGPTLFPGQELKLGIRCEFDLNDIPEDCRHPDGSGGVMYTPEIVGAIGYSSAFSDSQHQTGFVFVISRLEPPRPNSMAFFTSMKEVPPQNMTIHRALFGNDLAT